jgi:hypothetical protein
MSSDIYYRHWRKMNHWSKIKMWTEKKLMKPHKFFGLFKLYDTTGIGPYGGGNNKIDKFNEHRIKKFLEKYPQAKDFSILDPFDAENYTSGEKNPITIFLFRQEKYMKEGFSEEKAFELAEKEMAETLQKEKYERSLFEGLATSNRSRSLMSVYEQKAEYESRQKISQMTRDLGQFKRYQADLEERYDSILKEKEVELDVQEKQTQTKKIRKYEPVTYRTSDMSNPEGDNPKSVQKLFSARSEKLIDYFHSFSEIKDGISNLNDRDIILKAKETPQKLKDSFNTLMKKLEKYEIKLNSQGHIDYTNIKDKNALTWVTKNEKLITICLLCKDLNFEAPHIVNRIEIKNKIMSEIDQEEEKATVISDKQMQSDSSLAADKNKKTNYESYFGILPNYDADVVAKKSDKFAEGAEKNMKKFIKFDEFVNEFSNKYMFDNDLLYETYYYWEDTEEKEARLRELWINTYKDRLEKNIKRPESVTKDLQKLNDEIAVLLRNLRRKIDQNLILNRKHPIFGSNYRYLKREEFLFDSEVEFHKIKKFLTNVPEKIKLDPEIGYKYRELIDLLKRKKIGEATYNKFEDSVDKYVAEKTIQEEEDEDKGDEVVQEKLKLSGKSKSTIAALDSAFGNTRSDKIDEELGKVKESIVSHFESIIKTQSDNKKESTSKKDSGKKVVSPKKDLKKTPASKKK